MQRCVPYGGEAAALYARLPGAQNGRLLSLSFRTDGRWRDAWRHVTPELEARIDAIARSMREFHYGRFRLRFASPDKLMQGENFSVIEITGITGGRNPDPGCIGAADGMLPPAHRPAADHVPHR